MATKNLETALLDLVCALLPDVHHRAATELSAFLEQHPDLELPRLTAKLTARRGGAAPAQGGVQAGPRAAGTARRAGGGRGAGAGTRWTTAEAGG
jgi:hypothetical protein